MSRRPRPTFRPSLLTLDARIAPTGFDPVFLPPDLGAIEVSTAPPEIAIMIPSSELDTAAPAETIP